MILVLDNALTEGQRNDLCLRLQKRGFFTRLVEQLGKTIVSIDGPSESNFTSEVSSWTGVLKVIPGKNPYYLASRDCQKKNSLVKVGNGDSAITFGGDKIITIAGPCAIENEETALNLAKKVKESGCQIFRSMIFKPRSSPYSFQGLGKAGIPILKLIKRETDLCLLSEIRDPREIELVADHVDMFQVGTRNMSNFQLLKYLGQTDKPILLKRGMGASYEELLCAAEYLITHGNTNIVLCERGIRTFEKHTRFTLDIGAVPALKELSHLPVIIDPSHATGRSSLVAPLVYAGIGAGIDGYMVEIHDHPEKAYSDGTQAILPEKLTEIMKTGLKVANIFGKTL